MPPAGPSESSSPIALKSLASNQIVPEGRVTSGEDGRSFRVAHGADESLRTRWCPGVGWAHAVVVSVPARAEIVIAARRLAGARPHVVAVAGIVHLEDLWQLCRAELTGVKHRH